MRTPVAHNLADLVGNAARATAERTAFVTADRQVSWSGFDTMVDAAAARLLALGLAPGDRVALRLGNGLAFPTSYFGVLRAGLVAVPVNPGYTAPELTHVLDSSGARVLLTQVAEDADLAGPVQVVTADDGWPGPSTGPVQVRAGGEDLAVLLYTSGTSGRPRGAMLSHRALLANLEQSAALKPAPVTADDVVLLVLPLFHVYGLNAALGMVARQGATGVLVERFEARGTLEELVRSGVTCVVGAPPMYLAWSTLSDLGAAFSGVRLALSGSAPLPSEVLQRVRDLTGRQVYEGYGLTETSPTLTSTLVGHTAKPGSIGRPLPGIELRLLDDAGRDAAEDDAGEIVVRGANLFSGYWPDGAGGPDRDGWWATGDIAYADADGDLHIVDRRRELILVSGFNVYPREVEDVLLAHPDVREAAVLGRPHPYTGETVVALVVLGEGAAVGPDVLIAHCARSLARFKCPTALRVVPELPHSATGKVSKGRLRELAPSAEPAGGAP